MGFGDLHAIRAAVMVDQANLISAQTEPGEGKVVVQAGYQELEMPIRVVE